MTDYQDGPQDDHHEIAARVGLALAALEPLRDAGRITNADGGARLAAILRGADELEVAAIAEEWE